MLTVRDSCKHSRCKKQCVKTNYMSKRLRCLARSGENVPDTERGEMIDHEHPKYHRL